jgi:hypothetical protein
MEKEFRKTFEKMEGFSSVRPVTGLNTPNTGKEEEDDDGISVRTAERRKGCRQLY